MERPGAARKVAAIETVEIGGKALVIGIDARGGDEIALRKIAASKARISDAERVQRFAAGLRVERGAMQRGKRVAGSASAQGILALFQIRLADGVLRRGGMAREIERLDEALAAAEAGGERYERQSGCGFHDLAPH